MNRRNLLRMGVVGIASTVFVPRDILGATGADPLRTALAGSVFYTRDAPGRWKGKEGGHVPTFERNGNAVEVTTGHEMKGFEHYIVKHVVLDEKFGFVREVMFNPEKDAPVSEHDISGLRNVVYALSMCNQHDVWVDALRL